MINAWSTDQKLSDDRKIIVLYYTKIVLKIADIALISAIPIAERTLSATGAIKRLRKFHTL